MERKDIPQNLKWKIEDLYATQQDWDKAYEKVENEYKNLDFTPFKGKLDDRATLLKCLTYIDTLSAEIEKVFLYAHMRHHEDMRNAENAANLSKTLGLYSKMFAEFSFVEPELTSYSDEYLLSLIKDESFKEYDYRLQKILKSKAHVLSEKEERLLALASDPLGDFQNIFSMLDNANLNLPKAKFNGEEVQMSHGMYGVVLHSGTSEERKEWFEKYYDSYIKLIDAIAQTYYSNVKKNVFYKTVRNYDSCLAQALAGEDVDKKVYDNLIKATHDALPYLHDYINTRKQALGIEEQHIYDVFIPLTDNADIKLPFDEAYQTVVDGLALLGKDYQDLLLKGKNEGWIDVCESEGKRNGAYSTSVYQAPHPYVLLNYQETTNDVFTIAHEMGHALHTYKSRSAQPYSKADYTIFLAEIASTVNEVLLLKHLYKTTSDENLKKYLLNYYMETIRATLFRQTQFAEFEQLAHEKAEQGEALTKDNLSEIYYTLNKQYYGDGIIHDERIRYEWARIPHFYSAFYVYKYATGIISAISIVKRIETEGEKAVKDYMQFLSAGGSEDPVSILQKAGVDLTTEEPFKVAMQEFKDTLQAFKKYI